MDRLIQNYEVVDGKFVVEFIDVDRHGDSILTKTSYESLVDCISKCFGEKTAKQIIVDFGNPIVGIWLCSKCHKQYFPLQIEKMFTSYPFVCGCGEVLEYDEEA